MTSPKDGTTVGPADGGGADGTVSPWRGTRPELVIAGVLVTVAAVAGYTGKQRRPRTSHAGAAAAGRESSTRRSSAAARGAPRARRA